MTLSAESPVAALGSYTTRWREDKDAAGCSPEKQPPRVIYQDALLCRLGFGLELTRSPKTRGRD